MDYTNNPGVNKQPDDTNFALLAQLYGIIGGNETSTEGTGGTQVNSTFPPTATNGTRNLRTRRVVRDGSSSGKAHYEGFPDRIRKVIASIDDLIDNGLVGSIDNGWQLLHESRHGRAHEADLGSGYTVQIHYILAND
jgi:hypothetical protein